MNFNRLLAIVLCGPVLVDAAPDESALGREQGYPRAPSLSVASQDQYIVDSNSGGWESLIPTTKISTSKASPLPVARTPKPIKYQFEGQNFTLDDYLNRRRVTSLLVIKDGQVHHERFQYGRNERHRFNSASMAKSFLGLLAGWATEDGHIKSLDDSIDTYLPRLKESSFAGIRVRDLLTMSSGLAFEEGNYANPNTLYAQMLRQQARVGGLEALLELKTTSPKAPPGTVFLYSSLDSELLGHVITAATKKPLSTYLSEKLWGPIGAESDATWQVDARKRERAHCCIGATARDYAKVGVLIANDGEYQGKSIIRRDWLDQMASIQGNHLQQVGIGTERPIYGYGYHVWVKPPSQIIFRGLRGQAIYIDRKEKVVLVQTAVWRLGDAGNTPELEALWSGVIESMR
jgi:CubicO group peptidase (beta-lactamase class C family)